LAAADDEVSDAPSMTVRVRARETSPSKRARLDMGRKERRVGTLYMGVPRSERLAPRPRKGGIVTPTRSVSSVLSPDDAAALNTDRHAAMPAPTEPVRRPWRPTFELRCADVHPLGCEESLRARSAHDLVALACEHGGLAHGFTPVWYSAERLASIAAAITRAPAEPVQARSTREAASYARREVVADDVR
jgi:hypothetical protein